MTIDAQQPVDFNLGPERLRRDLKKTQTTTNHALPGAERSSMNPSGLRTPNTIAIGVFIGCFFLVGIPFWMIPYSSVTVPNSLFFGSLIVLFTATGVTYQFGIIRGILATAPVLPSILMARVIVEALADPTRHNLWPLALIIVLFMGGFVSVTGAALGLVASRMVR